MKDSLTSAFEQASRDAQLPSRSRFRVRNALKSLQRCAGGLRGFAFGTALLASIAAAPGVEAQEQPPEATPVEETQGGMKESTRLRMLSTLEGSDEVVRIRVGEDEYRPVVVHGTDEFRNWIKSGLVSDTLFFAISHAPSRIEERSSLKSKFGAHGAYIGVPEGTGAIVIDRDTWRKDERVALHVLTHEAAHMNHDQESSEALRTALGERYDSFRKLHPDAYHSSTAEEHFADVTAYAMNLLTDSRYTERQLRGILRGMDQEYPGLQQAADSLLESPVFANHPLAPRTNTARR